jgi:Ca2+-transporting ATPase
VSLIVAAVPESLPAVITLALALGSRRMAQPHAIVRRLAAVETLGSVTVLATDKTGTLTEGRMVVERVWAPGVSGHVTGLGYSSVGEVLVDGEPASPDTAPRLAEVLEAATLCNDASLIDEADGLGRRPLGDPMEAALLVAAEKLGLDVDGVRGRMPRLAEVPFDTARRCMATAHRRLDGVVVLVRKGAPEILLATPGIPEQTVRAAHERASELTAEGFRVLAVTVAELADLPPDLSLAEETAPRVVGLVALVDPPRATAADTLDALRAAGITPVLITGDHEQTALNVARRVGIAGLGDAAVSGEAEAALRSDPSAVAVFARTTPQQKLEIVRGWQAAGEVVAMTGDGVNDGPALHASDIGVAMGERGTEVARQAADLVLADDDLGSLVAAVEEGRRIYANVRRFLLYGLAGGLAEILIMLLGPLVGIPLPLLPAQILWVNLLTHGLTGVALGAEPAEPDALQRGPRPPSESILGDGLWQRVAALGTLVCAVSLGLGLWAQANDRPVRTLVFLSLGAAQLGVAAGVRSRQRGWGNPMLLIALPVALLLQLAGVWLGGLRELLGTESVSAGELLAVLAAVVVGYLATRVVVAIRATAQPVQRVT